LVQCLCPINTNEESIKANKPGKEKKMKKNKANKIAGKRKLTQEEIKAIAGGIDTVPVLDRPSGRGEMKIASEKVLPVPNVPWM
jgi:hypothetical protein